VSGIEDGAISTSDGNRSRKLSRTMEVFDTVGAGEGRARVRNPGFCIASSRELWWCCSSSCSERIVLSVHVIVNGVGFTLCDRRDCWISDVSCEDHSLCFLDLGWSWLGSSSISSFSMLCRAGVAMLEELARFVLLHDSVKGLGARKALGRGWNGDRCR